MDDLRGMLHAHSAISFGHVRRESNKAVDLLANAGVEGEVAHQWGPLENFEADDWAHQCRQMVAHELEGRTQVARSNDAVVGGDRRREHTMTDHHQDA